MSSAEWKEIGIPEGYEPHRLLYNAQSETIIIELRSISEEFSPNKIYIRTKNSSKYESLNSIRPLDSCESAVTSSGKPVLFYLSYRIKKLENGWGGDWLGLYSFNILNHSETEIVSKGSLLLPSPYNRGWVSTIVSASEDASTLVLTVGMTEESNSQRFCKGDHHLASLNLETNQLSLISKLKGTFF